MSSNIGASVFVTIRYYSRSKKSCRQLRRSVAYAETIVSSAHLSLPAKDVRGQRAPMTRSRGRASALLGDGSRRARRARSRATDGLLRARRGAFRDAPSWSVDGLLLVTRRLSVPVVLSGFRCGLTDAPARSTRTYTSATPMDRFLTGPSRPDLISTIELNREGTTRAYHIRTFRPLDHPRARHTDRPGGSAGLARRAARGLRPGQAHPRAHDRGQLRCDGYRPEFDQAPRRPGAPRRDRPAPAPRHGSGRLRARR